MHSALKTVLSRIPPRTPVFTSSERVQIVCVLDLRFSECRSRCWQLLGGLGYLAPGDEVNLVVLKKFPEGRTGEEIEIALPPGCAPGIALAGCSFHFAVSESKMNDKFGDSGRKVLETVEV